MKFVYLIASILIVGVSLAACAAPPTPSAANSNQLTSVSPLSPVGTPQPPALPQLSPTLSDKSLGGASGRFVLRDTGQPTGGFRIYLGERLALNPGDKYAITIQQNSSPHTDTAPDGRFTFVDIKPGTYALVVWTPNNSLVIPDPNDKSKELIVTIKSGQIAELGDVVSNMP